MNKLSVVISAFNEEKNIEDCLRSVKDIATEIIVIDNTSSDKTADIARKYTDKVFVRENNLMLNINKNFGIGKAAGEWVLVLDADERLTEELAVEIKELISSDSKDSGYTMPRKNIIFGKWIENTGWYPDRQLRLFKKNSGRFAEKHVHEMITIDGSIGELKNSLSHINYTSVSQFLDKMIRVYTISEAENLLKSGYVPKMADAILMPSGEFLKRFFAEKGYKDGAHGLYLSLLMAFYHFIVFLRVWEAKSYPDNKNTLEEFTSASKESYRQLRYWITISKNENEKNPIKKISRKILHKIS